jgi:predicted nucleic acid-binding protein
MMTYVLDTNIFRKLLEHFPKKGKAFEAVWQAIDENIDNRTIISVDECFNEIANHYSADSDNLKWVKLRKEMFLNPSNEESLILKNLFQKTKMQESVHTKNILSNRPSADAYIAVKAKALNATVVTSEVYKEHSAQLPNICEELGVKCISYDDFMELLV